MVVIVCSYTFLFFRPELVIVSRGIEPCIVAVVSPVSQVCVTQSLTCDQFKMELVLLFGSAL